MDSGDYVLSGFIIPFWSETLVNTPRKHDVDRMLYQCWPTICDVGPTSNQHWFNTSCLLHCLQPSKHKTLLLCVLCGVFWKCLELSVQINRILPHKICSILGCRPAYSSPIAKLHDSQHYDSFYTNVISGEWPIEQTLTLCCFNVGPTSSPVTPYEV